MIDYVGVAVRAVMEIVRGYAIGIFTWLIQACIGNGGRFGSAKRPH